MVELPNGGIPERVGGTAFTPWDRSRLSLKVVYYALLRHMDSMLRLLAAAVQQL